MEEADIREMGDAERDGLRAFHRAMIAESSLKIVLLCGPRAEDAVLDPPEQRREYQIKIHRRKHSLFTNARDNSILYLRCPMPPLGRRSRHSLYHGHVTDLCEVLQMAKMITATKDVFPFRLESRSVLLSMIALRVLELDGQQIFIDDLGVGHRSWLARKGFVTEEDVGELAVTADGQLMKGLLALCQITRPVISKTGKFGSLLFHGRPQKRKRPDAKFVDAIRQLYANKTDNKGTGLARSQERREVYFDDDLDLDQIEDDLIAAEGVNGEEDNEDEDLEESCTISQSAETGEFTVTGMAPRQNKWRAPADANAVHNWSSEDWEDKWYKYTIGSLQHIHLSSIRFSIPREIEVKDNLISLKLEVAAENTIHPNTFIRNHIAVTTAEDPARRLAIKLRAELVDGRTTEFYARSLSRGRHVNPTIFKANSMVDKLVERLPWREILKRQRRMR